MIFLLLPLHALLTDGYPRWQKRDALLWSARTGITATMAQDDGYVAAAAAGGWIVFAEGKDNECSFEGVSVVMLLAAGLLHVYLRVRDQFMLPPADWLQKYRPSRAELQNFAWIS